MFFIPSLLSPWHWQRRSHNQAAQATPKAYESELQRHHRQRRSHNQAMQIHQNRCDRYFIAHRPFR